MSASATAAPARRRWARRSSPARCSTSARCASKATPRIILPRQRWSGCFAKAAAAACLAYRLGDNTAKELGRVSFNPLKHIDPFGTVILPGVLLLSHSPFLFGYAKPVPVNFRNLNNPRLDMVWVALAGPATNILLALAAAFAFHALPWIPPDYAKWTADNLKNTLIINVVLAVFNMLPIPPLDGGGVAVGVLPKFPAFALAGLEPYCMLILVRALILLALLGAQLG